MPKNRVARSIAKTLTRVRKRLATSDLLAFNLQNRDRWVAAQAALVPAGSRVLDVGAGSAPYRALFSRCDYKTQDFLRLDEMQLRDGGYGDIDFVCDAAAIPVPPESFDVVLCTEVLEHVPDPIAVIREIARVLAAGGRVVLTAPLGSGIHQEPYHYYGGYTPFWYRRFLGDCGFDDISIEANDGTFRHFSQEAIRFIRMTRPFALGMPIFAELAWLPFWCALAPVLAVAIPVIAKLLDRFDLEQRFTVGYHVTAVKRANGGSIALQHGRSA
jgi:ubiquinone/menaquinone biosynthesis C-methylase UbiE